MSETVDQDHFKDYCFIKFSLRVVDCIIKPLLVIFVKVHKIDPFLLKESQVRAAACRTVSTLSQIHSETIFVAEQSNCWRI